MDISKTIIKAFDTFTQMPKSVDDVFALDAEMRDRLGRKL